MNSKRPIDQMRTLELIPNFAGYADANVLIKLGNTWVLCSATMETFIPQFLRGSGSGWLTAEYAMLPTATNTRNKRESSIGKQSGRTQEIQRLIGRSLRAGVNLAALGEHSIRIDCDVLQADGGTRTAAIIASWVAVRRLFATKFANSLNQILLKEHISAISVGIVNATPYLDLDYALDSNADCDLNIVATDDCQIVEIQGTAEKQTFSRVELNNLLDLAMGGITTIQTVQQRYYQP